MANQAVFLAFVVLVCLLGGASRHDAISLIVLRPLAVLAVGYALLAGGDTLRLPAKAPLLMLAALAMLIAAQLVPLPPGMWEALPARGYVDQLDNQVGLDGIWRPLTLTPGRTWNSLFAMSVPLATFLLYARQTDDTKKAMVWLVIVLGGASMIWGMLQLVGGVDSIFYTYRIHTDARPIGFFANRNHQAIFIAITMFFAGILINRALRNRTSRTGIQLAILGGYLVLALAFEFILGSRGGLLLAIVAIFSVAIAVAFSPLTTARSVRASRRSMVWLQKLRKPWVVVSGIAVLLAGLLALAASLNRNEAFSRMWVSGDTTRYDRLAVLPYLAKMARDQFPSGSGFGSFDSLFKIYEPTDLLTNFYLNQAHNDWMQFLIEGGLVAGIILFAFVAWLTYQAVRVRKAADGLLMVGALGSVGFASLFDYPLRVPIVMMVCVITVCLLADHEGQGREPAGDVGRG